MGIISVQSHVAYGYVGNKAAVYPLQSMSYDVWPVNTVQFSNHPGYGKFQGKVFSGKHIQEVLQGLEDLGVANKCQAILSGYMGNEDICKVVQKAIKRFKTINSELIYLCDPVIGDNVCYVKPEILEFFRDNLEADIITPNQFEAEILSGIKIISESDLNIIADYFHKKSIKIVVLTGVKIAGNLYNFVSDGERSCLLKTTEFSIKISGAGDLFSAIYLGSYLAHKDAVLALRHAADYTQQVVQNTIKSNKQELQVLSVRYDISKDTFDLK